jgi:hypothetical protein
MIGIGGTSGTSSSMGEVALAFFDPKEKVRPALDRNPEPLEGTPRRVGVSCRVFLGVFRASSDGAVAVAGMSAEDGAVDALLCRDEASAEDALVKLEAPLPLVVRSAWTQINGFRLGAK